MNLALLADKLAVSVRRGGVVSTLRRLGALARPADAVADPFDRRHGTDTAATAPLWRLSIASPNARHGERYEATEEGELQAALASVDVDVRQAAFVDLGCGKGRTLVVAARAGFATIVGVEFASELVAIARDNLGRCGAERASVLHADAADFAPPAGDLVLYLYNPFDESVMSRVLDALRQSPPARQFVIYKQPRCAALLDASGFLHRVGPVEGAPHMHVWRRNV